MKNNPIEKTSSVAAKLLTIPATAILFTSCATSQSVAPRPVVEIAPSVQNTTEDENAQTTPTGVQIGDIPAFANRVEWPEQPAADGTPAFNIQSGSADNVWVEGKGYFRGSLENVYKDLTDAMIIGPTHLTQNIERDEFVEDDKMHASYVMHVKMKYIFSIEFDLSSKLEPIYEGNKLAGLLYQSEKTSGTRFIDVISDTIFIKKLENNWFSVEFHSINIAAKNKEDEARAHAEGLFAYWEKSSSSRASASSEETAASSPAEHAPEQAETAAEQQNQPENTNSETASSETSVE